MERQAGVGRRANESPLAGLDSGLPVHTLVHVAAPLVGADGLGAREPCTTTYPRRPYTADRATTRDRPYKTPAGERRGNRVRRRIRAAHAPPIWRPQGIAPTRHPQERGAGTMYDDVSAPPMHRRSGDHKGSPLQDTRRREARESCTTAYPRRPSTTDRATTRDRPYKTPTGKRRGNRARRISTPPIHRRSGDHKGSPLQDTRRGEAREPCTTTYPRRQCTADRATTRDRPYKTPAVEGRRNNGVVSRLPLLAIDGGGIVPPAFPAPLAHSGSTG